MDFGVFRRVMDGPAVAVTEGCHHTGLRERRKAKKLDVSSQ
jgi:hypothetical protein